MVWYNNALALLFDGTFGSPVDSPVNFFDDPINVALMKTSYAINRNTHVVFDDVDASEIVATGYTSLEGVITGATLTIDSGNNRAELTCDNLPFTALGQAGGGGTNDTFDQIVVARKPPVTGQTAANTLLISHSTVASTSTIGGDILLQFSAEGMLQMAG